jgi:hypothetical protein
MDMKPSRFAEERIIGILREQEAELTWFLAGGRKNRQMSETI